MIKKFHQLFESNTHLRSIDFFKEYFRNMFDEYDCDIEIIEVLYSKKKGGLNGMWDTNKFPKEGYQPHYELYLSSNAGGYGRLQNPKELLEFNKSCQVFHECYDALIRDNVEFESTELNIYLGPKPAFRFKILDLEEVPETERSDSVLADFQTEIEGMISNLGYKNLVEIKLDEKNRKLFIISGNEKRRHPLTSNQVKAILRRLEEKIEFSKNDKKKFKDVFTFDYKLLDQEGKLKTIEISNIDVLKYVSDDRHEVEDWPDDED